MEQYQSINNISIRINQTQTSGKTIIFLHGNSLSSAMFQKQLESNLFRDYRLISFDFQGHGKSAKANNPPEDYSMKGFLRTTAELIKKLEIQNAVLAGHSFGGHVAIESLHFLKDIVDGLVIFGTPPLGFPPAMEKAFLPRPEAGLMFKPDLTDSEIKTLAQLFCTNNSNIKIVYEQLKKSDPDFRTFIGMSLSSGKGYDEIDILKNFNKPIAIIHGENDPLINLNYIEELAIPGLWNNKINIIPKAYHSPQLEHSDEFNILLKEFIDSVF